MISVQDQINIDRIVSFLMRNGYDHLPEDILKDGVRKTIESNLFVVVEDRIGIAGITWFDIIGFDAHVKRVFIREDLRGSGLLKYLIVLGWKKFPFLKRITFERLTKYPDRLPRIYELKSFFKGE